VGAAVGALFTGSGAGAGSVFSQPASETVVAQSSLDRVAMRDMASDAITNRVTGAALPALAVLAISMDSPERTAVAVRSLQTPARLRST